MLRLNFYGEEMFDDADQKFVSPVIATLELEHSLVSLSKWESFWEKPFLGKEDKTDAETLSYVHMMALDSDVPDDLLQKLTNDHINEVNNYIAAKMTATWFAESPPKPSKKIITAEVIYYWMISLNIPFECQYWHLNRLLTLIKVCDAENAPPKKQSTAEIARRNRELNAKRKQQLGTSG